MLGNKETKPEINREPDMRPSFVTPPHARPPWPKTKLRKSVVPSAADNESAKACSVVAPGDEDRLASHAHSAGAQTVEGEGAEASTQALADGPSQESFGKHWVGSVVCA